MGVGRGLRLAAFAVLIGAAAARVADYTLSSPRLTPDSFDYLHQSRLPLLSEAFWGSQHPPLLPLLWKLTPGHAVSTILLLNVVVGIVCWSALALTACRALHAPALRFAAIVGVLALSLAPEVAGWDSVAVSESLSISLGALFVAQLLRYATAPTVRSAAGLASVCVAFGLLRDTSIPLVGLSLVPIVAVTRRRSALVVCSALAAVTAASLWGQVHGRRSDIPTRNAIAFAISGEGAGPWFESHGLPLRPNTAHLLMERPTAAFATDPRAANLRRWLHQNGRATWIAYLGTHPDRTLRIATSLDVVYDPPRAALAQYWSAGGIRRGFFPRGGLLAILAALAAAGAAAARARRDILALGSVAVAAMTTAVLMWDADAVEFYRHAVLVPILTRIVLVMLAFVGVDRALRFVADTRAGPWLRARRRALATFGDDAGAMPAVGHAGRRGIG